MMTGFWVVIAIALAALFLRNKQKTTRLLLEKRRFFDPNLSQEENLINYMVVFATMNYKKPATAENIAHYLYSDLDKITFGYVYATGETLFLAGDQLQTFTIKAAEKYITNKTP